MAAYLLVSEFRLRTTMPQSDVDSVEVSDPGFIAYQLSSWSSRLNAQLAKRYAAPFSSPVPEVILDWLTRIVTPRVYLKRGVNPSDQQFDAIKIDAETALKEVEAAVNSQIGMYDLPPLETSTASGVTRGGPQSYSETSPYAWTSNQYETAVEEDC